MKLKRAHPHYMRNYLRRYRARPVWGDCPTCGAPAVRWYAGARSCQACINARRKRPLLTEHTNNTPKQ